MPYANGRIYVDTSVTPNLGVCIADVQKACPVTIKRTVNGATESRSSSDLGVLCGGYKGMTVPDNAGGANWQVASRVDINMWARYKPETPVYINTTYGLKPITLNERRQNGYSIYINQASVFGSISRLVTDLRDNGGTLAKGYFVYRMPTGGSASPYRLTDFENYWKSAPQPIRAPYNPTDRVFVKSNGDVDVYYYVELNGSEYGLGLTDLRLSSDANQIGEYYFGILLYDPSGSGYYAATQTTKMKNSTTGDLLGVTIPGLPQLEKTYQMVPFIATLPITNASASYSGSIYPMAFASQEIMTRLESRLVIVSTNVYVLYSEIDQEGSNFKVYMDCSIVNQTDGVYHFRTGNGESYIELGHQGLGLYRRETVSKSIDAPANRTTQGYWEVINTGMYAAYKDFIRNGDTNVHIVYDRYNESGYVYSGIVEMRSGHAYNPF